MHSSRQTSTNKVRGFHSKKCVQIPQVPSTAGLSRKHADCTASIIGRRKGIIYLDFISFIEPENFNGERKMKRKVGKGSKRVKKRRVNKTIREVPDNKRTKGLIRV